MKTQINCWIHQHVRFKDVLRICSYDLGQICMVDTVHILAYNHLNSNDQMFMAA